MTGKHSDDSQATLLMDGGSHNSVQYMRTKHQVMEFVNHSMYIKLYDGGKPFTKVHSFKW